MYYTKTLLKVAGMALVLFLAGCGDKEEVPPALKSIAVTPAAAVTLSPDDTHQLTATPDPSNAVNVTIQWTSSNTNTATVDNKGLVTAVAVGTASITAKSGNITSNEVSVTVSPVQMASFTVTPSSLPDLLVGGDPVQLVIEKTPADGAGTFTFASDNADVVTVNTDGLVTIVGQGTANITVTPSISTIQAVTVPVTVSLPPLESFTVTPASLNDLWVGDPAVQLVIEKTPPNAGVSFTFASGDPNVVTVSADGLVTIVGKGSTNITVTPSATGVDPVTVPVAVSAQEIGLSKAGWTATSPDSWTGHDEGDPARLLDGDLTNHWHTDPGKPLPASFTVDMNGSKSIGGFYLYHRPDGDAGGISRNISIAISTDNTNWTTVLNAVQLGERKSVLLLDLPQEVTASYFKVTVTATNGMGYTFFAEVGAYNSQYPYQTTEAPARQTYSGWQFKQDDANNITLTEEAGYQKIATTGGDPGIFSRSIGNILGGAEVTAFSGTRGAVKFEYKSNQTLPANLQIYWCAPDLIPANGIPNEIGGITVPHATEWTTFSYDIEKPKADWTWGTRRADHIRFDPGNEAGYEILVKNFRVETY
jgi:uncharacterized protein YjdB